MWRKNRSNGKSSSLERGRISARMLLVVAALPLACLSLGCTATILPAVSESEFLTRKARVPGTVVLCISDQFREYTVKQTDVSDLKEWEFELGAAVVDAFRFDLESRIQTVDVCPGQADFSAVPKGARVVVVQPRFEGFKAGFPIAFKFENYWAELTIGVDVYDASGKVIHSGVYQGKGKKQGAIGYASAGHAALPVAAREAILEATKKAVDDVVLSLVKAPQQPLAEQTPPQEVP